MSPIPVYKFVLNLPDNGTGARLDLVVYRYFMKMQNLEPSGSDECLSSVSRSQVAQWIAMGRVRLDGNTVFKAGTKVKIGQTISVDPPEPKPASIEADSSVPFAIVYQDEDIVVVDKPAGVIVHPGAGAREGTLVHGLLARVGDSLQGVGDEIRPGIVHRLDKNTSGLMVVAKNSLAHRHLANQFRPPRCISRTYLALVRKLPREAQVVGVDLLHSKIQQGQLHRGTISLPIGRHPQQRQKMAVQFGRGRDAVTHWKVKASYPLGYLLELDLETGRTHQIRVHLAALGAPILGDPEYGESPGSLPPNLRCIFAGWKRQALHAARLEFHHPSSGELLRFESPLPPDMIGLIELLSS